MATCQIEIIQKTFHRIDQKIYCVHTLKVKPYLIILLFYIVIDDTLSKETKSTGKNKLK